MATHLWTANRIPVGPEQAEITMSLIKCGLWSCRIVISQSGNLQSRWGKALDRYTQFWPRILAWRECPRTWQLHHDNAPAHSSHLIQTFLAKHSIPVVRQAPYSPDMAPCDFWLFPFLKWKMPLKGARFEDTMRNVTAQLNTIPKDAFLKCFQQWRNRWAKCVHYQEDYFED
jgi:hypothetical protein